jgi:hypothetical protein
LATNVKFKRDAISLIRDGIKSQYKKASCCAICDTDDSLELHHYHTVSLLVKNYAKEMQLDFTDEETVLSNRTALYDKYWHELVEDTVTLCTTHHQQLHKVYSKEPPLFSAGKQKSWVQLQRDKINSPDVVPKRDPSKSTGFSRFLK